jgi:coenzyme Q-binding protein COQ10
LDAHVYEKNKKDDLILIIADLTIGKGPFKDTYKSDVRFNQKDSSIKVTNIEGPLNYLTNTWHFDERDNGTEIFFDIDFEIENKFLNIVMIKSFKFGLNKIADAFQKRAETLYK